MLALLIDDHTLFSRGLELLLKLQDPASEVLIADSCEQALGFAGRDVDLIFLDYYLPGLHGMEGLDAIRAAFRAPIIMLSGEEDPRVIRSTIDHGAAGYVPKTSSADALAAAVRTIVAGGIYLPRDAFDPGRQVHETNTPTQVENLSVRQREVLAKAIQGKANKVIAREMSIAEGTVKAHLSAAFRELGVHNRTEAVYQAARLGLQPLFEKS
jgi:DNA-binding NarL/FixJ family response regulator